MYGIAITAASCLRAGTDVRIAWLVDSHGLAASDPTGAVAITPGGGRMGSIADGLLDAHLTALPSSDSGLLVPIEFSVTDALIAGVPEGAGATLAVVPADRFPEALWALLLERRPVCLTATLDDRRITSISLTPPSDLDGEAADAHAGERSIVVRRDDRIVTVLHPVPRLAVFGAGPIVDALESGARWLGWQVERAADPDRGTGLMNGLARTDSAIITGHDVEAAGRVLEAALDSGAGYIGSIGSIRMQDQRADWLAYRGVTDLSRVHGPAGVDIGARTPAEIALSVLAEAVAVQRSNTPSPPRPA